jgi:hypothetical protein
MSHSFPSLNDGLISKSSLSDDSCNIFKPLFRDACQYSTLSPQQGLESSQAINARDSEDQVRQKGLKRGFEAGRQDACSLARQELTPEIKTFAIALGHLSESLIRIEKTSCQKILETALSIADKILGGAPDVNAEALSTLKVELKGHMVRSYQLQLMLNCEDMEALSEFMSCENPQWQECDYIKLDSSTQVQRGALRMLPDGHPKSTDDTLGALTLSLENMLAEVSTK